ncbi:hypothetical protein BGX24_009995 [Mortierella sp. AD032]|nr:hypothetical protein BGX24_009995 [Mortierella sp. AD032]
MFARPVDPFFAYNSAFSAAERHHKEMLVQHENNLSLSSSSSQQELGPQQQPYLDNNQSTHSNNNSKRRKHSLHFEQEFLSALDSSLQDPPPVLSRPRPCKKPRRSTTTTTASLNENHIASNTTNSSSAFAQSNSSPPIIPETLFPTATNKQGASVTPTTLPRASSSLKAAEGPSIIDLSSGEELVVMKVGQNDHKRPRECLSESSSSSSVESLREVYDVQEDGSLCPVLDHAPALPSPTKRSRVDSTSSRERPLDEMEQGRESKRLNRRSTARARNTTSATNNMLGYRDEPMESADWMSDDDGDNTRRKNAQPEMALIRYEGPKTVTLADGVDALIQKRWNDDHYIPALNNLQGNELVLYRPPPLQALRYNDDNDNEPSVMAIEELDDDDIYQSSNDNSDSLIHELEDKIMDMDLD